MSTSRLKMIFADKRSYDIRVGRGLLDGIGDELRSITTAQKAIIITDSNVGPLYLERLSLSLRSAGFEVFDLCILAGESSKNIEVASELWEACAMLGVKRNDLIVALGGGVVGDLAGFVASTYMRGLAFVQVPTSLLAMVDSSIGGKTAINLSGGKNLVGSFHQPIYVLVDVDTLSSLPADQWQNGFAEIAKSALLDGGDFYSWLQGNTDKLAQHDMEVTRRAIVYSLSFKARVVAQDEKESGLRECLNYGHSFAHALEAASGFAIQHGCAVAEGIRFASRLAVEAIAADNEQVKVQDKLLDNLGLHPLDATDFLVGKSEGAPGEEPTSASISNFVLTAEQCLADKLFEYMLADKKNRDADLRFVFVEYPGNWQVIAVDPDLIKIYLIFWEQAHMQIV